MYGAVPHVCLPSSLRRKRDLRWAHKFFSLDIECKYDIVRDFQMSISLDIKFLLLGRNVDGQTGFFHKALIPN